MAADDLEELRLELDKLGGVAAACARSEVLEAIVGEAWAQGWAWELVCDARQAEWVRAFRATDGSWAWGHGRQRGKSFGALALVDAVLRQHAGARARYCALTLLSAKAILSNAEEDFYATCPEELRPHRDARSDDLLWPNGSRLVVLGTDAKSFRRGRGFSRIALQVLDECGFYQDLEAVDRALGPSLQVPGPTGRPGRTLYCSTPSESPAHPWTRVKALHRARGRLLVETYRDNPRVDSEKVIADEMAAKGLTREELLASTAFRREFGGEDVVESTRAAVPTWTLERAERLTVAIPRPAHFDAYESLDLGFSPDPSFVLFGFFDFARNGLVIERELECRQKTVAQLAAEWKAAELEAWGVDRYDGTMRALEDEVATLPGWLQRAAHASAPKQPFLRVGDDNALVLAELAGTHGIAVMPTRKDEKALAVDFLCQLVASERLFVNPACVKTLEQLASTIWDPTRTEWERTATNHGEAIDCLVYMARNVRWHRDPRPRTEPKDFFGKPKTPGGWNDAFRRSN